MKKEHRLRHPVVSGLFYPDGKEELRKEIEIYMGRVDRDAILRTVREETGLDDTSAVQPLAVIAPHAGFMFSASVQACSYALLEPSGYETVVIVGPAHQTAFEGISISKDDAYGTPLGEIEVDTEFAKKLIGTGDLFRHFEDAHLGEHAIEVQVPFIQFILPKAKIVPVLFGEQNLENAVLLKNALVSVVKKTGRKVLIVASTDLSHYHAHVDAENLDGGVIERVRAVDPDGLDADIQEGKAEACGFGGLLTGMLFARELGQGKAAILRHINSSEVSGDRRKVVGYLSAVLY
jgi:AmmeMemoRadiSam system protein B